MKATIEIEYTIDGTATSDEVAEAILDELPLREIIADGFTLEIGEISIDAQGDD